MHARKPGAAGETKSDDRGAEDVGATHGARPSSEALAAAAAAAALTASAGGGPLFSPVKPKAGPKALAKERPRTEDSLLTDDEDHAADDYYRSVAQRTGEWCAESDDCWWVGAEALVADDLATPAQKVEPKPHFANERTMIHWFRMACTVTALASGILAFGEEGSLAELFGLLLSAFACGLVVYAVRTFHVRGDKIRQRLQVRWDDPFGPVLLGAVLIVAFTSYFILQLIAEGIL